MDTARRGEEFRNDLRAPGSRNIEARRLLSPQELAPLTQLSSWRSALAVLQEALSLRERCLPTGHWQQSEARLELGRCLAALGRTTQADSLLDAGSAGLRAALGPEHPRVREAAAELESLRSTGRSRASGPD